MMNEEHNLIQKMYKITRVKKRMNEYAMKNLT